jgi:hypothetical protein
MTILASLRYQLIIWWMACFPTGFLMAQENKCKALYAKISTTYSNISIDRGYICQTMATGRLLPNIREVVDVPYSELETITAISAGYRVGNGKRKAISEFNTRSLYGGTFYSGISARSFVLESDQWDVTFDYNYTLRNEKLIFLSFLPLAINECVDTLDYTLIVPRSMNFHYEVVGDTGYVSKLIIAQTESNNEITYKFTALVKERYEWRETLHYATENDRQRPGIRISLVPAWGNPNEFTYLNKWYCELVSPRSKLNEKSIAVVERWGAGKKDEVLMKSLFDSVKAKISYIDFENGIGAVQPRSPDDVLVNKQGDCKDMSNLLRLALIHHGFDARLAISSTLSHPYDLDFPAISSANHVICVVNYGGQRYYLDPTESFGLFGLPSRQIQGRYVLVVDTSGFEHVKVPVVPSVENKVYGVFRMNRDADNLSGKFVLSFSGLSRIDWETLQGTVGSKDYGVLLKKTLTNSFKNIRIDSLNSYSTDTAFVIEGFVEVRNAFLKVENKEYLSQNMLMFPHLFPRKISDRERLVFYETMDRNFIYIIQSPAGKKLKPAEPVNYSNNGLEFNYHASKNQWQETVIRYRFASDNLVIDRTRRSSYNELGELMERAFNKKLTYE